MSEAFKLRFWEITLEALGPGLWKRSINGASSGKGQLIREICTIPRSFFLREIGGPSPSPKMEIPFLGRDQMRWRPTSGAISGIRGVYYAQDGAPDVLD
jgi:hypothetical protein